MRSWHSLLLRYLRVVLYGIPAPPVLHTLSQLAYRTFRNFMRNDGPHMAAGVSYYGVFSLFPVALAAVAIAGFIVNPPDVQERILDFLNREVPGASESEFVTGNLQSIAAARGAFGILALTVLIWSGRAVFGAIRRVLNRAWRVSTPPPFLTDQIVQISSSAAAVLLFIVSAVGGSVGATVATRTQLFPVDLPWEIIFQVLPFFLNTLLFVLVYRIIPNTRVRWREALPAGITAGLAFEVAQIIFGYYLTNFSSLDLIYGSITTFIAVMLFLYVASLILVWGAELSSEIRRTDQAGSLNLRKELVPERGGLAAPEHRPARHGGA